MYGKAIDPQAMKPNAVVLRPHWQYAVKRDGTRRSRQCCDGSERAAPKLRQMVSTWSSCVELPIQRLFLGIAASKSLKLYGKRLKTQMLILLQVKLLVIYLLMINMVIGISMNMEKT